MTFRDAAEYCENINITIEDIHNTLKPILRQDTGPLEEYSIGLSDMRKIVVYLNKYIRILEDKLNEEIK